MGFGLFLPLIVIFCLVPRVVQSSINPDCDYHKVIMNVNRICKTYAYMKRSTQEFIPEGMGNEVLQWQPQIDNTGRPMSEMPFKIQNQNLWMGNKQKQQPELGYYQLGPRQDLQTRDMEMDALINPMYYAEAEFQATLERWRRDEVLKNELTHFIRTKCCVRGGCAFPTEYLELERRTNICNFR